MAADKRNARGQFTTSAEARGPGTLPLVLLCMAQFMLVLDVAIVNVALPSIQRDLAFSPQDLQLVVTAYLLTFGGLLLLGGRAADLLGRRRVFVAGLALFTLASLTCGLAQSAAMLVVARALQGIGGALLSPSALSLLITIFPEGDQRNRALGVWGAVAAVGGAAGLLIGGVLTDLASWRWVFLINVPIGLVVAIASLRTLPEYREAQRGRIDGLGALSVTAGLIALVYGLSRAGTTGFGDAQVILTLVVAAALFVAFVLHERRAPDPLVPFALFRLRTLTGANLATLFLSAVILGVNFFLTLYFQQVLAYSPLQTGLAFLPLTLLAAVASSFAAQSVRRFGARVSLLVGMLCLACGALLLSRITVHGSYVVSVFPGLLLVAIGIGFGYTVGTLAATAGVPGQQQGIASGILATSQQIGGAVGLAILATIASAVTSAALQTAGAASSHASAQDLLDGYTAALLVSAGFALVAALLVWVFIREPDCQAELVRRSQASGGSAIPMYGLAQTSSCQPAAMSMTLSAVNSAGDPT